MTLRIALIAAISLYTFAHAERYALLVGNATGKGPYAPLKYVENDIDALKSMLTDFCGFEQRNVLSLYNGQPEDLDKLLSQCAAQTASTKNNMFLFYYSGHADQQALKMGDDEYPLAELKEKLSAFPSDIRIGIFDACQSGSFTRLKGGALAKPFLFRDDGKTKGQVFLSSSSVSENAQESDAYRNSIFTFHFVNALRGSGDLSGDGRVTLSEAYQYAYNHTVSSTAGTSGGIQHPSYQFKIQGEGDIVLADLNIRTQGILLTRGLWGDITIFDERGFVVADLAKDKNAAVLIALSPGEYRIVATQNGARLEHTATLANQTVASVRLDQFVPVAANSSNAKGAEPIHRTVQLGFLLSGVYERFDLASLANGLNELFQQYRFFSISPSFSFPSRARYTSIQLEAIIREHFIGRLGFCGWSSSATDDYQGARLNDIDKKYYGYLLHLDKKLDVFIVDFGTGYQFTQGVLNHGSLLVGLDIYTVGVTASSIFTDSLYNVRTRGSASLSATMAVPYIAAGYRYPIASFCDVGAEARYRYQAHAGTLTNTSLKATSAPDSAAQNSALPQCNFSGFDGRLFITFHVKFGTME